MEYVELQIATTLVFLVGESLLIFKRKAGWAWRQIGLTLLVVINYLMALYLLIIPTVASMIIGLLAYLKWRKDERKKQQETVMSVSCYLYKTIKAAELTITHGLILATPALKIKQMKLRQIETELKTLQEKK